MPALENVEAYVKALHRKATARYLGGYDHETDDEANKEIMDLLDPILQYLAGQISETTMTKLVKETNDYAERDEQDNINNPYDASDGWNA